MLSHPLVVRRDAQVFESDSTRPATISELMPWFQAHLVHELRRSRETLLKYTGNLEQVVRMLGDLEPGRIRAEHVLAIKAKLAERGVGASRISSVIAALKAFLSFCRLAVGIPVIDPKLIRAPRIPKREVVYLTPGEVQEFLAAIPVRKRCSKGFSRRGLCFRALAEVLLGTGMRLSEALSLRRDAVNYETGEARIVGKGNKERTVFFTPRALNWVKEYVSRRTDSEAPLFLAAARKPLRREAAIAWFRRLRQEHRFTKRITAHMLRHTVATTLLFNGCPIGHIKEILGHELLTTTCKFYLGTDKRAAKEAHAKYLDYDPSPPAAL